jgi:hypothetical protein
LTHPSSLPFLRLPLWSIDVNVDVNIIVNVDVEVEEVAARVTNFGTIFTIINITSAAGATALLGFNY